MSKRKKKLYARKYQPWYQKKGKIAASMEAALAGDPPKARGKPANFGLPVMSDATTSGVMRIDSTRTSTSMSKLRVELDSILKELPKWENVPQPPHVKRRRRS